MRRFRYTAMLLIWMSMLSLGPAVSAEPVSLLQRPSGPGLILVLNAYQAGLPVPDGIDRGIVTALRAADISMADVYIEKLDLSRNPDNAHRIRIADVLRHKLAGKPIGVVIVEGFPAIEFVAKEGLDFIPDDALLITLTTPSVAPLRKRLNKVVDIPWRVDPAGTLKAALDVFPKTRRVIVVTGARDFTMPFLNETRQALIPWKDKLAIDFTNAMTYEEMIARVSTAPPDTVIIYAPYFNDTTGRSFVPAEVAGALARTANAPIFTIMDTYMGDGFVGGSLITTEQIGEQAARTAVDYLNGNLHLALPVTTLSTAAGAMFDWSALKRWKADMAHLPENSTVINRPPTLWSQYKESVIAALAVILALTVLVLVSATQNRRRALAEKKARLGEARLRVLIDQAPDAIVVYDADRNRFVDANPRAEKLFGCSRDELCESDLSRFYPLDQAARRAVAERIEEYFAQAAAGRTLQLELKVLSEHGDETLCEVRLIRLPSEESRLFRFSFVDITERKQAEQALADEAVRRRILIEQSRDGIVVIDQKGKVYEANPKYAQMLGYTPDEIRQLYVWDWDAQLTREQILDMIRSIDATGDFFETRHRRKDGTLFDVEVSSSAAVYSGQKLVFCVCRDISERKLAEKALRESEQRFRQLFEGAAVPLCFFSKDGVLLDYNASFVQAFGYTKADVPTLRDWWPLAYPDPVYRRWVVDTWEAAVRRAAEKNSEIEPIEYQVTCKNGDVRTMVISGTILGDDFLATFFDVTERKRAEAERERLMTAIEQTSDIIFITDPDGSIQFVNAAFEAVTGYSRQEAIGNNPRILRSGRQDDAFYRKLWTTISEGRPWRGRIVNKRKDGTLFTEEATISPVRDATGRIVNYVASKRDITEHLQLEEQFQQVQKMESVGRLAGGVAHDFNNMLSVIIGYAEFALEATDPGTPLHADLTEIYETAHRSADLTRQLLAFARKQTIDPKVLDLNRTVAGMLKMLHRVIGEDIELAWLPGAALWPIKMDPTQIDQVLVNLCVNARDAITGGGRLTIETENWTMDEAYSTTHADAVAGEYVMMAVSDNGCGMDNETQRLLFEPFFTTKEMGKGTGLGLSTVYGIVKQNNGFLNVYSEIGRGTTFKIYIPRHGEETIRSQAPGAAELPRGTGKTVLLVEDEPAMLKMSRRLLEKLGYTVVPAGTPTEAIRQAEAYTGEIHLLMTDVVMPEMNGQELAERLLAKKPGMKCLFMSGYTADVIAHHGVLKAGVHFIAKPFSKQALAAKVRETLGTMATDTQTPEE